MRFRYYPETDSLYIDLAERPGAGKRAANVIDECLKSKN